MKYYFKENFRLLYADGALYDSHNNPVYTYRNQTLFFPQIDLFRYGEKVGHVKKNFTFFLRQYDIFVKGRMIDTLNQQFTLFRQELQLERLGWTIKGDFLALSYQIYDRNGNMICEVDQELFHLTRQYYVNILDESQELLIILVVLAINQYDKDLSAASSSASHHSHSNH
ncbi:MAG: hypothetical protein IJG59_04795 [Erysipelotrichaceae bacterium]|nr:hypothetical protein [Erysipelotrichaceae bacterium]